mmetsp:Transcript_8230/g.21220  ORF Transcript_8230/g.21220 Transcript_8230/m.21220 type:complete len:300 (+) Transcript_8230:1-900(+)
MGEREGHHRHHKRHHKRRKHREIEEEEGEKEHHGERRERKSRKHRHREKEPESTEKVDFEITPIAKDDFFLKNPEFCVWLVEHKGKYFGELSSDDARKLFSDFVRLWNDRSLAPKFYHGIGSGSSVPRTRPSLQAVSGSAMREEDIRSRRSEMLGERERRMDARQQQWEREKMDRKRRWRDNKQQLDEMFPKATGRDALHEKKAAQRQFHRESEVARASGEFAEVSDRDLMGGDRSFQAAKAQEQMRQDRRNYKQDMKRLDMEERRNRYQAAEDQKLDQFRALIQQQKGPIKIQKRNPS